MLLLGGYWVQLNWSEISTAMQFAFSQSIIFEPKVTNAYLCCGLAYYRLGKFSTAIAYFAQGIRLCPTSGLLFLLRGAARERLQDSQGAYQDNTHGRELYQQQEDEAGYQKALKEIRKLSQVNETAMPSV